MQVKQINNNKISPQFKSINQVLIPKPLLNYANETKAEQFFIKELRQATQQNSGNILSKFLNLIGINPKAITFFNYPGYKNIQKDVAQSGINGVKNRLNYKYNLFDSEIEPFKFNLPEESMDDSYSFFILTGKEKKAYSHQKPFMLINNIYNAIYSWVMLGPNPGIDKDDIKLLNRLVFASEKYSTLYRIGNEYSCTTIETLDELPEVLNNVLKSA